MVGLVNVFRNSKKCYLRTFLLELDDLNNSLVLESYIGRI
jgi:hypothetical protein